MPEKLWLKQINKNLMAVQTCGHELVRKENSACLCHL